MTLKINKNQISRLVFSITVVLFAFGNCAKAHHGGEGLSGVGIAGPIITVPASTLPKKKKFISIFTDYINFNEFSNSKLMELDRRGEHVHSTASLFVPSISAGYGLTDNLTLGFKLPYVFRFGLKDIHDAEVGKRGNSIGVGDITFFSQYRFYKNKKSNLNAAIVTALKIPSGVTRTKGRDGEIFEADEQPGSGSWDPLVGLAISKKLGKFSVDTNGLYKFVTNGSQGSNLGDVVSYNLAVSHRLFNQGEFSFSQKHYGTQLAKKITFDTILEANGTWSQKPNTFHGFIDQNHGGTLIYLSPGFRFTYDNKWIWSTSVGLPTIEDLNGRQKAPSIRLITAITKAF